jgi:hypothetical protein
VAKKKALLRKRGRICNEKWAVCERRKQQAKNAPTKTLSIFFSLLFVHSDLSLLSSHFRIVLSRNSAQFFFHCYSHIQQFIPLHSHSHFSYTSLAFSLFFTPTFSQIVMNRDV